MSFPGNLLLVAVGLGLAYIHHRANEIPPIPKLERTWWGKGEPTKQDESIRPFKINISDTVLTDLSHRLENHHSLTPPLEDKNNFEYGFNTNYLPHVISFWRHDYNWRDRELHLNIHPQYKTRISGLDLHYYHVKPKNVPSGTRIIPILLIHGWPGSVKEFYNLIPILTTPREGTDFVFEVVIPSLPGYGFSESASKAGLGAAEIAVMLHNLMERIGLDRYYVQGWGSFIATNIAILYPENVIGLHANMCFVASFTSIFKTFVGSFIPSLIVDKDHAHLMYPFSKTFTRLMEEMGYLHLQGTKPDTIGVALRDSPIGLAAYLLERISSSTNPDWKFLFDGGLTEKFTLTDLLDNVMIYWVTGSITTSMRMYKENFSESQVGHRLDGIPCKVPTACAAFPHDFVYQPRYLLKQKYPELVRFVNMPRGGHLPAFEEPELMGDDVWETARVVEGRRTYLMSKGTNRI